MVCNENPSNGWSRGTPMTQETSICIQRVSRPTKPLEGLTLTFLVIKSISNCQCSSCGLEECTPVEGLYSQLGMIWYKYRTIEVPLNFNWLVCWFLIVKWANKIWYMVSYRWYRIYIYIYTGWWFQPNYPSEKLWSSLLGMMNFPTEWKVIIHSCCKPPTSH